MPQPSYQQAGALAAIHGRAAMDPTTATSTPLGTRTASPAGSAQPQPRNPQGQQQQTGAQKSAGRLESPSLANNQYAQQQLSRLRHGRTASYDSKNTEENEEGENFFSSTFSQLSRLAGTEEASSRGKPGDQRAAGAAQDAVVNVDAKLAAQLESDRRILQKKDHEIVLLREHLEHLRLRFGFSEDEVAQSVEHDSAFANVNRTQPGNVPNVGGLPMMGIKYQQVQPQQIMHGYVDKLRGTASRIKQRLVWHKVYLVADDRCLYYFNSEDDFHKHAFHNVSGLRLYRESTYFVPYFRASAKVMPSLGCSLYHPMATDPGALYFGFVPKQPIRPKKGIYIENPVFLMRTHSVEEHQQWSHFFARHFNLPLYKSLFPSLFLEDEGTKKLAEKHVSEANKEKARLERMRDAGTMTDVGERGAAYSSPALALGQNTMLSRLFSSSILSDNTKSVQTDPLSVLEPLTPPTSSGAAGGGGVFGNAFKAIGAGTLKLFGAGSNSPRQQQLTPPKGSGEQSAEAQQVNQTIVPDGIGTRPPDAAPELLTGQPEKGATDSEMEAKFLRGELETLEGKVQAANSKCEDATKRCGELEAKVAELVQKQDEQEDQLERNECLSEALKLAQLEVVRLRENIDAAVPVSRVSTPLVVDQECQASLGEAQSQTSTQSVRGLRRNSSGSGLEAAVQSQSSSALPDPTSGAAERRRSQQRPASAGSSPVSPIVEQEIEAYKETVARLREQLALTTTERDTLTYTIQRLRADYSDGIKSLCTKVLTDMRTLHEAERRSTSHQLQQRDNELQRLASTSAGSRKANDYVFQLTVSGNDDEEDEALQVGSRVAELTSEDSDSQIDAIDLPRDRRRMGSMSDDDTIVRHDSGRDFGFMRDTGSETSSREDQYGQPLRRDREQRRGASSTRLWEVQGRDGTTYRVQLKVIPGRR